MATIASLIVRVGADSLNLRTGLARAQRDIQQFARNASRLKAVEIFGRDTVHTQAVTTELNKLRGVFGSTITALRGQFARGIISREQFFKEGRTAAQEFNKGVLSLSNKISTNLGRNVTTNLKAGLLGQLKDVDTSPVNDLTSRLSVFGDLSRQVGTSLTRNLTVPIVGFGIAAGRSAGSFEAEMNRVKAIVGVTGAQLDSLRDAALRFGQTTPFSPKQVAEGITILGQAGLKTGDILKTLQPIIDLATVEQVDFDSAARTVIRTMAGFQIPFDQAATFVDKFATASISGTVTMTELGDSFKYVGTVAKLSGQDFDVILAALTQLAQKGLPASLGGTALRGALSRLYNPSKQAAAALKEIGERAKGAGLHVLDAQGKMLPLQAILKQLNDAGITAGETLKIFGQRAGPGMAALVAVGADSILDLAAKLKTSEGSARQLASTAFQGLYAQLKKLAGAFVALAVAIGDTGILKYITGLVLRLTSFIQTLARANPALLNMSVKILGIIALMGPLITLIGRATLAIVEMRIALLAMAGTSGLATLATFLGPGAIILTGLAILAVLFHNAAKRAIEAAAAMKLFSDQTTHFNSIKQFNDAIKPIAKLRDEILAAKKLINDFSNLSSKGQTDFLGSDTQREKLRAALKLVKEHGSELDELNQKMDILNQAKADFVNDTANKGNFKTQLADMKAALEDLLDSLDNTAGVGSGTALDSLKALAQDLVTRLEFVDAATKGASDRVTRMAGPLEAVRTLWERISQTIAKVGEAKVDSGYLTLATQLKSALDTALKPDTTTQDQLTRQADDLLARIQEVKDATKDTVAERARLAPLIEQEAFLEADVRREIEKQGGIYQANISLVRLLNRLVRDREAPDPINDSVKGFRTIVDTLVGQYTAARDAYDQAVAQRDTKLATAAQARVEALEASLKQLSGSFAALLADSATDPTTKAEAWAAFTDQMRRLGIVINSISPKTKRLVDTLGQVGEAANAFGDLLTALGRGSDEIDRMIQGVDQLAQAFQTVLTAKDALGNFDFLKAAPGLIGIATGAANVLGSILGPDKERNDLIRQNNDRIAELTSKIDEQIRGLGQQNLLSGSIAKIDLQPLRVFDSLNKGLDDRNKKMIQSINSDLSPLGFTFQDVKKAAEDLGIELYDAKGRLQIVAFDQLNQALEASAEAARTFTKSLDNQASLIELKAKLQTGREATPEEQVTQQTELFGEVAPKLQAFLGAIDTTTAEGRDQLRAGILRLVSAIETKQIDAADFGDFKNADELLAFLNQYADSINALDEATKEATRSMLNVPEGFKLALNEFRAQDPFSPTTTTTVPGPGAIPRRAPDDFTTPLTEQTTRTVTVLEAIYGAINKLAPFVPPETQTAPAIGSETNTITQVLDRYFSSATSAANDLKTTLEDTVQSTAAAQIRTLQDQILASTTLAPEEADVIPKRRPSTTTGDQQAQVIIKQTFGDVIIQGADKTAREQWAEVKKVAKQEAMATYGDPSKWGEVP